MKIRKKDFLKTLDAMIVTRKKDKFICIFFDIEAVSNL